jgi:hypothetical protein
VAREEKTDDPAIRMKSNLEPSAQEVLAGLVERVTFHNAENGFCVLRAKARGYRDLVTVIGHAAVISAGLCVCRWIETAISGYGPLSTDSASGESHNAVEYCAQLIPDALSLWTG